MLGAFDRHVPVFFSQQKQGRTIHLLFKTCSSLPVKSFNTECVLYTLVY